MNRQVLNPLGMSRDVENRPALHLPTQTDEELLIYAASFAATALEKELAARLEKSIDSRVDFCHACGCPT